MTRGTQKLTFTQSYQTLKKPSHKAILVLDLLLLMVMQSKTISISLGQESNRNRARALKSAILDQRRSQPHVLRKVYHLLSGLGCFAAYAFFLDRSQALWTLGIIGGTFVTLDILRFRFPAFHRASILVFGKLMRREELRSLTGNTFYVIGLFLITLFFPKPVVLLSILFLAFGDPIAALVGARWGRVRIWKNKSLEGALANFLIAIPICAIAGTTLFSIAAPNLLLFTLAGATISMIAELVPFPIDDNFTIPVLSSLLISTVLMPLF